MTTVRLTDLARTTFASALACLALAQGGAVAGLAAERPVPACALKAAGTARVDQVVDGDTVVLADGRQVRLVGIQAPKLPLGRKGFTPWPLAEEAKAALEGLVLGAEVSLADGGEAMDRHGRVLAHLSGGTGGAGRWVQGEMVAQGMARAYSFADNRACARELQAVEGEAREAGRGIWALDDYAIRRAGATAALRSLVDTFQIVEGRVQAVAIVGGRVYLNFGADYRTDFTASIDPRDTRNFPNRGRDLKVLEGRLVRIRGWLGQLNGPMIEVSHPEQIEVVEADAGRDG